MKTCKDCDKEKPLEAFYADKRNADGLGSYCKSCQAQRTKEWRAANKERVKENQRRYKKENRAIYTAAENNRRASKLQRTPSWSDMDEITLIYKQAKSLEKLLGRKMHVDHVVPLQGDLVSGLHVPDNMQILFAEDNLSKNNRYEVA